MSPSSLPIFPFQFCLLYLAPSFLKRFSSAVGTTISIILNANLPAAVHERLVFSSHQARAALSIQYRPWAFRPGAIEVASSNEGIYRYRLRRRISGDNFPVVLQTRLFRLANCSSWGDYSSGWRVCHDNILSAPAAPAFPIHLPKFAWSPSSAACTGGSLRGICCGGSYSVPTGSWISPGGARGLPKALAAGYMPGADTGLMWMWNVCQGDEGLEQCSCTAKERQITVGCIWVRAFECHGDTLTRTAWEQSPSPYRHPIFCFCQHWAAVLLLESCSRVTALASGLYRGS